MLKLFKNIINFLLAVAVVFSTLSFSVNKHYCGKVLVDKAVFNKAKACCFETPGQENRKESFTNKNCCSNTQVFINGQNELKNSFPTIYPPVCLVPSLSLSNLEFKLNFFGIPGKKIAIDYPPPGLKHPLFVYFDTFLI
ncbi:hypothetical protein C7S20_15485 [Christiangramia fulva]|uniref:Secreted protein n=1 Tax=Christiangramia fulva TaxID=2126553 RepID=A0A2R3Z8M3_9FLAO|nr:hypothetical protein [Christiangramia fulva]AVR46552.1 hypothetical protein C7S20_15485 [Christiangramia fulva]